MTSGSRGIEDDEAATALRVDVDRGVVRLQSVYAPQLVAELRALPGGRYLPESREWVVPARRDVLRRVAALIAKLGDKASVTRAARRRIDRACPGRIERHPVGFRVRFGYTRRRHELVRKVAERRWDQASRSWRVPATRAGALELLALLESGEFTAADEIRGKLERLAAATPSRSEAQAADDASTARPRSSPTPHWRHVTRGPIFNANPERQEWIEGVGWCVRIRVDPTRRASSRKQRQEAARGNEGDDSLAPTPGRDAPSTREQPDPLPRQRREERDACGSERIRREMREVAREQPSAHDDRDHTSEWGGDLRCEQPDHGRGQERVRDASVTCNRAEGECREPQHEADETQQKAVPLERAPPMHARPEPIDVGQPRAIERGDGGACRLDCGSLEHSRASNGDRDADELVGAMPHAREASPDVGWVGGVHASSPWLEVATRRSALPLRS